MALWFVSNERDVREMPSPSEPLRVVVADDHPFYREGLARLLRESGIDAVACVPNGEAAIEAVRELAPDVVVMDLNMPGMSGVEATRRLSEQAPATRVLVLSVSESEHDVTEAILAGARGYVLKDGSVDEVVAGIRMAAAGGALISPRVAMQLLGWIREHENTSQPRPGAVHLSERELEVLSLLAEGKANNEIADSLFISASTVRNHISSILIKLQVENRVQAAVQAVRQGLV